MERYIDMHCHILPGVDDGAMDQATMVAMLQTAYDEGVRCIIATPHFHPRRGHATPEVLRHKLAEVRKSAHQIDERFRIYLGTEIYFGQDVVEKLQKGEILTMNKREQILVEFSPSESYQYIKQGLQQLQMSGYEVILAHAERYQCLLDEFENIEHIWNMGVNIQVNAGSITGQSGTPTRRFVKKLLSEQMVFAVASDAHDDGKRAPRLKKAAQYVSRKYGSAYAKAVFYDNAMCMLRRRSEKQADTKVNEA